MKLPCPLSWWTGEGRKAHRSRILLVHSNSPSQMTSPIMYPSLQRNLFILRTCLFVRSSHEQHQRAVPLKGRMTSHKEVSCTTVKALPSIYGLQVYLALAFFQKTAVAFVYPPPFSSRGAVTLPSTCHAPQSRMCQRLRRQHLCRAADDEGGSVEGEGAGLGLDGNWVVESGEVSHS